jgi:hypothetical protein
MAWDLVINQSNTENFYACGEWQRVAVKVISKDKCKVEDRVGFANVSFQLGALHSASKNAVT